MAGEESVEGGIELRQLVLLAHRKLRQNRRLLLENAADLFLSAEGRLSERERSLMSGIVRQIVHEAEMLVRPRLFARLSAEKAAPGGAAGALAGEAEEIAYPILAAHGILNTPDLVRAAKYRIREHQFGVAVRAHPNAGLPEAGSPAGAGDAIAALLQDADAEIAAHAQSYLVSESQRLDRFQQPRVRLCDLPADQARALLWWACAGLRQYVLANARIDEARLDTLIYDAATEGEAALGEGRPIYAEADAVVAILAIRQPLNGAFLIQCLRAGRLGAFTAAFARLAAADVGLVQRVLYELGGEDLAVLCRAAGLERALLSALFLWTRAERQGTGVTPATVPNAILRIYDAVSQADAAAALRYWRLDDAYLYAIDRMGEPRPRD